MRTYALIKPAFFNHKNDKIDQLFYTSNFVKPNITSHCAFIRHYYDFLN